MATTARDSVVEQAPQIVTLHRAYASTHDAENAIERLLSAGVPAIRIELIMGRAVEDARDAPIGTFAGTTTADAQTVGSYADIAHSGRDAIGTFAGDPDKQRRGAFSDTDRVVVLVESDSAPDDIAAVIDDLDQEQTPRAA